MGVANYLQVATILSGQTESNAVEIPVNSIPVAIFSDPSGMTGTTLTFKGLTAASGGQEAAVKNGAGGDYSLTIGANQVVKLDQSLFSGFPYVKVISNSSEGANRNLTISCQNMMLT